jgi:hypothetical protein
MQYIIGAVIALIFICGLGAAFLIGYRMGKAQKAAKAPPPVSKEDKAMLEEQKRREDQLQKDFRTISGYNLNKALERKKV